MKFHWFWLLMILVACNKGGGGEQPPSPFYNNLPPGIDEPVVPEDNPLFPSKIALGEKLFFETGLSADSTLSCASCHLTHLAFTDGKKKSIGVAGREALRNAPTILYTAYHPYLFMEGGSPDLENQVFGPIENENEMDLPFTELVQRLNASPGYVADFKNVFNDKPNAYTITRALAAYERTLTPFSSKYDDYLRGVYTLTPQEERGRNLFFSDSLNCNACHTAPIFSNFSIVNNGAFSKYDDGGLMRVTTLESDKGKFKVPVLRNIEKTGPYMHNGEYQTLSEIIENYARGGKGYKNQSELISSFNINSADKEALIAFLKTLTDSVN